MNDKKKDLCEKNSFELLNMFYLCRAAHSANFDEKVHKPQIKSYGRIGANMQLIFTHIL